jgi:hypothetical protein
MQALNPGKQSENHRIQDHHPQDELRSGPAGTQQRPFLSSEFLLG